MIANKLVESWLDNQSERQYQPAFIQLLLAEGWEVLHNTRHSPLEFGKDVIARDPSGQLFAIQLKGNPGSRLTKSQGQQMLPQIFEGLTTFVPSSYQKTRGEKHVFVICTNGEIDEEAVVLFENQGQICGRPSTAAKELRIWGRGSLLPRFIEKLDSVWPSSIEATQQVLRIYTSDGLDLPKPADIARAIRTNLNISGKVTAGKKLSHLSATLLLAEILKDPWRRTEDHYALFLITVISAIACCKYGDSSSRKKLVKQYTQIALEHAESLMREAIELRYDPRLIWAQRSPLAEFDIMAERRRLIADSVSTLIVSGHQLEDEHRDFAHNLIDSSFGSSCLWGQAVIPSMILRFWAIRKIDATLKPEHILMSICRSVILAASNRKANSALTNASPYYSFEDVLFVASGGISGEKSSITEENHSGRTYFAKSLFYMLALRNWKQTCKTMWRTFSNLLHEETQVPKSAFLTPELSDEGVNKSNQYHTAEWSNLVNSAIDLAEFEFGDTFEEFPWLLAAYLSIVPYRATPNTLLYLDQMLSGTWYNSEHRPG